MGGLNLSAHFRGSISLSAIILQALLRHPTVAMHCIKMGGAKRFIDTGTSVNFLQYYACSKQTVHFYIWKVICWKVLYNVQIFQKVSFTLTNIAHTMATIFNCKIREVDKTM